MVDINQASSFLASLQQEAQKALRTGDKKRALEVGKQIDIAVPQVQQVLQQQQDVGKVQSLPPINFQDIQAPVQGGIQPPSTPEEQARTIPLLRDAVEQANQEARSGILATLNTRGPESVKVLASAEDPATPLEQLRDDIRTLKERFSDELIQVTPQVGPGLAVPGPTGTVETTVDTDQLIAGLNKAIDLRDALQREAAAVQAPAFQRAAEEERARGVAVLQEPPEAGTLRRERAAGAAEPFLEFGGRLEQEARRLPDAQRLDITPLEDPQVLPGTPASGPRLEEPVRPGGELEGGRLTPEQLEVVRQSKAPQEDPQVERLIAALGEKPELLTLENILMMLFFGAPATLQNYFANVRQFAENKIDVEKEILALGERREEQQARFAQAERQQVSGGITAQIKQEEIILQELNRQRSLVASGGLDPATKEGAIQQFEEQINAQIEKINQLRQQGAELPVMPRLR